MDFVTFVNSNINPISSLPFIMDAKKIASADCDTCLHECACAVVSVVSTCAEARAFPNSTTRRLTWFKYLKLYFNVFYKSASRINDSHIS